MLQENHGIYYDILNYEKNIIPRKSTWEPDQNHHTVITFIEAINNDIKNLVTKKTTLPKSKEALKELANGDNFVVSKADKGGATVIQDIVSYIQVVTRHLKNTNFYKKLTINRTLEYSTKINTVKDNFKKENLITEKTANSLILENPRTPRFYTSPQIHKQRNPERPVNDSINSYTSNLSKFIDHYLQPYVQNLPSYVQGTPGFFY